MPVHFSLTTANTPGAVAIVQLHGDDVASKLREITSAAQWPPCRMNYVNFAGIDTGLAVLLREDWAQLMPHGGPRIVQKLIEALIAMGCVYSEATSSREQYPEASSELEADMLVALSRAASPVAIDLLLNQPGNWQRWFEEGSPLSGPAAGSAQAHPQFIARNQILSRLITPSTIVVIGQPNVGKSTLTNRMLGRAASIVADLPGTTRDWVAGLAELPPGIAVRWMDTPGLRGSDDVIEQQAIELANQVIREADVVIVMRDASIDWPDDSSLPRKPDVWVMNKVDDGESGGDGTGPASPLRISAEHGFGIDMLTRLVIVMLGLDAIASEETWAFSERLRSLVAAQSLDDLRRYANV